MSTCPIHALPIPQVAHEIWTAASAEEKAALSSEAALEQLLRRTHNNGGLNLPPKRESDKKSWDVISQAEAVRFLDGFYANSSFALTAHAQLFAHTVEQLFFGGHVHGRDFEGEQIPLTVDHTSDGDTSTLVIGEEACGTEKVSVRYAGIDTPESLFSAKLREQIFALLRELQRQGKIDASDLPSDDEISAELARHAAPNETLEHFSSLFPTYPLVTLMARRMVYDGKVASAVLHGLIENAQTRNLQFKHEESFVRNIAASDKAERCDLINAYDKYGRRLSIVHVSSPDYVSDFISHTLPTLGEHDKDLNKLLDTPLSPAEKNYLKTAQADITLLLNPKTYPRWQQLFSPEHIAQISSAWQKFAIGDRKTDLNLAMVTMGVAFSYVKYRMQYSDIYSAAESEARQKAWALWQSPVFATIDLQGQHHKVENGRFVPFTPQPDCLPVL